MESLTILGLVILPPFALTGLSASFFFFFLLTAPQGTELLINLFTNIPKKKKILGWQRGGEKNQVWPQKYKGYACVPNYMGACSQASPCHTQTETDGNILYLALLLLLGGDVTQFSLGIFFMVYLLQMTMLTCGILFL